MARHYPGVAQLVARLLWEQDAAGSNPVARTSPHLVGLCITPFLCYIKTYTANYFSFSINDISNLIAAKHRDSSLERRQTRAMEL